MKLIILTMLAALSHCLSGHYDYFYGEFLKYIEYKELT